MKKIIVVLVLALAASMGFAQNVHFGARAALNFGTLWGADTDNVPWGLGFVIGGVAQYPINEKFSIVPGLDIDMRRQSDDNLTWTTWTIDIPVMARYLVNPQFFVEGGLMIDFIASSEEEITDGPYTYPEDISEYLNIFELGFAIGGGYKIMPNLDINARLALGLTSILDGTTVKNMQIQIGASYWFK